MTYSRAVTAPSDVDAEVVAALVAWRDWHRSKPPLLSRKRLALAALESLGMSRKAVARHVATLLEADGWSAADIAMVGVSAPQVRTDLERAPLPV